MSERIVTIGPKAYSFHDQSTGITIIKGQEKTLSSRQLLSRKIQKALATGHLVYVANREENAGVTGLTSAQVDRLVKKLTAQYEKGMEVAKMAKGYNLEQAKAIAKKFDLEADADDTVITLLTAVIEEISSAKPQ